MYSQAFQFLNPNIFCELAWETDSLPRFETLDCNRLRHIAMCM